MLPNPELKVAIVGRPNVGKSSLFNKLTRSRKAVVKNQPGVTRDVLIEEAEWWGRNFQVLDTGGVTEAQDDFSPLIKKSVERLLSSVDLILFVVDSRAGLIPEDHEVFRIVKSSGVPFLIVANKVDETSEPDSLIAEFYELGDEVLPAAFESDRGISQIVEWILSGTPRRESAPREGIRFTLAGKPNVGKSSLCNQILGNERVLVSDVAGTTVDAVEEQFEFEGEKFIVVDTAGVRRSARRDEGVERISAVKSYDAIDRSELVLLLVDGRDGPTKQDARVLEYAQDHGKPVIIVANKYDLARKSREDFRTWFEAQLEKELHFMNNIIFCHVSAKTGYGVAELLKLCRKQHQKMQIRIPTSKLNKFFTEVIRGAPAPVWGTKDVKFYYLTQTRQVPPSFIAFANHPDGVTESYKRFITKRIQNHWDLAGIPIRIYMMPARRTRDRSKASHDKDSVDSFLDYNAGEELDLSEFQN